MRIIIIGGGIGGIAAAVALRKEGFDPLILEQAPSLAPVGAGVNLSANALKALVYLGADKHVRETSVASEGSETIDLETGERIFRIKMGAEGAARFGEWFYQCYRPDVMDALLGALPNSHIRLGSRVIAIEQHAGGVRAQLAGGETIEGDLLVGADGLNSAVRTTLFGERPARFTGHVAWRALIPAASAPQISMRPISQMFLGVKRHVIFFPVHGGQLYNFVGFVPAEEVHRESWTISRDVAELRASFSGVCEEMQNILDAIQQSFITGIYFRDPLSQWSSNRIVLLGDAAHPVPPSAAQGACMALEDAVTLAICLRRFGSARYAEAFQEYQRRRFPWCTRVLVQSRVNLRTFNESDPVQTKARNGYFRGLARLDPIADTWFGWLYRYDPVAAAHRPLAQLEAEAALINPMRRPESQRAFEAWRNALTPEDNAGGWLGQRAGYERFAQREFAVLEGVVVEAVHCNAVNALRVSPNGAFVGPVVLHLHGGGFVLGSAQSAIEIASRLAQAVGGWALIPDYRLAPEHPFPAAIADATAVYRWLVEQDGAADGLFVTGEDAGGALALETAIQARRSGLRSPNGLYLVSPFCDLTLSSPSIDQSLGHDSWYRRQVLTTLAACYLQETEPSVPLSSPVHGVLQGLPPLLIHAAAQEALRDDAVQLDRASRAAGVDVTFELFDDTVHSFVLFSFLPETRRAIDVWATFANRHAQRRSALNRTKS